MGPDADLHEAKLPTAAASLVIAALLEELGAGSVLTGEQLHGRQFADWSEAPATQAAALLLPRTPQQVAAALRICHRHGLPVVVQGGLTGMAGGANPSQGEFALSLARMNSIEDFDEIGGTVLVQAGLTLQQLQEAVEARGWSFPLDLGARGSCQLGGNAATNAGGNRVLRHGMMRQNVLGLEVVLADGTLIDMLDRVIKNNAGFDLKQLFIGSEGTLGVITRLSLRLQPVPGGSCTALCGVGSFRAAAELLRLARQRLPGLAAFELMWDDFLHASASALRRAAPFDKRYPLYLLLENQGPGDAACAEAMQDLLEGLFETGAVQDAVIAGSLDQSAALWHYREAVSELLSLLKPCAAFDVSVAMPQMEGLVEALRADLNQRFPGRSHLFFGHLGDGNLHLASGPYPSHEEREVVEALVYSHVGRCRGSISAEHGVGVLKKGFLATTRSPEEMLLMKRLRQCLDPQGVLNRGRVLDTVD